MMYKKHFTFTFEGTTQPRPRRGFRNDATPRLRCIASLYGSVTFILAIGDVSGSPPRLSPPFSAPPVPGEAGDVNL